MGERTSQDSHSGGHAEHLWGARQSSPHSGEQPSPTLTAGRVAESICPQASMTLQELPLGQSQQLSPCSEAEVEGTGGDGRGQEGTKGDGRGGKSCHEALVALL